MSSVINMPAYSPAPSRLPSKGLYNLGCAIVALISVHDAVLLVVNHSLIVQFEQNPIGRWLLELGQGEVWLFVAIKLFTTSLVTTTLLRFHDWHRERAWFVMSALFTFQLGLLCYLTF